MKMAMLRKNNKKKTPFSLCKYVHYCVNTVLSSGMEAAMELCETICKFKKNGKLHPEKTIQNNENKGAATIGTDEWKRMQVLENITDFTPQR